MYCPIRSISQACQVQWNWSISKMDFRRRKSRLRWPRKSQLKCGWTRKSATWTRVHWKSIIAHNKFYFQYLLPCTAKCQKAYWIRNPWTANLDHIFEFNSVRIKVWFQVMTGDIFIRISFSRTWTRWPRTTSCDRERTNRVSPISTIPWHVQHVAYYIIRHFFYKNWCII